jgi:hypothetical protein
MGNIKAMSSFRPVLIDFSNGEDEQIPMALEAYKAMVAKVEETENKISLTGVESPVSWKEVIFTGKRPYYRHKGIVSANYENTTPRYGFVSTSSDQPMPYNMPLGGGARYEEEAINSQVSLEEARDIKHGSGTPIIIGGDIGKPLGGGLI